MANQLLTASKKVLLCENLNLAFDDCRVLNCSILFLQQMIRFLRVNLTEILPLRSVIAADVVIVRFIL